MEALAAVLHAARQPLRLEPVDISSPGRGEVLVRMHAAGVCRSDLHVMTGENPMPSPIILGHEGAGIVVATGRDVTSVERGDHVIPIWRLSCGTCSYCRSGRPALCDVGTEMRFRGTMPDGTTRFRTSSGEEIRHYAGVSTFSQLSVIPENAVLKIPKSVPLELAALIGCGVITGMGAVRHAACVTPGASVAVFGVGGIGLNIVQGARLAGAARIIAIDPILHKLELARRLGATDTVLSSDGDPVEVVRDLTNGEGVDYTFEAFGSSDLVAQAYEATRKGGTCTVVGITGPGTKAPIDLHSLVYAEKTLRGSLYGSARPREELAELIEQLQRGELELECLLTRTYPLGRINEAFEDLQAGRLARGMILPQEE